MNRPTYTLEPCEHARSVVILRGLPGSGKTTFIKDVISHIQMFGEDITTRVVSADDYHLDERDRYVFRYEALRHAHAMCLELFLDAVDDDGVDVIFVDNTNMSLEECVTYQRVAECKRLRVSIVTVHEWNADVLASRNTHGVDASKIESSKSRFQFTPARWQAEKIDFYPSRGARRDADSVARSFAFGIASTLPGQSS
jgi:adenylate kinase family enzyme